MQVLPPIRSAQSQSGMSLLEALIVMTIIAIITSFALPAYSTVVESQHRITTLHSLHHMASLARSEAVKRNSYVAICPSSDGQTCLRTKDYSHGWIMFENTDQDYPVQRDTTEPLIDQSSAQDNPHFDLFANRYAFTFRPMSKRNTNGTFITCPKPNSGNNTHKYQSVVISYTGRPRIEQQAQGKHREICP